MILQSYQVDSFTKKAFSGNPACVVLLDEQLPFDVLMKIAKENAVPETAFILPSGDEYILRWFTPDIEMDLCGHATLASAHILFTACNYNGEEIHFNTASGMLTVKREGDKYFMDFPMREAMVAALPEEISDSLNIKPKEVYKARDYMLVYPSQKEIEHLEINRSIFDEININPGGVIVTAPGENCDFVSRYFTPQATILEDPVTGSAHCTLAPYWSHRLKKETLEAKQLSARGGEITCTINEGRVIISGNAVTYSKSDLYI
ncbi:MAG: PhzF family phenazine biosynthesis protein [Bacteroidales bacterium]|nr:PhzF family phenazine biosynthesis protein [Bacteroidales bacterium]MDD4293500.1 PhzF family phenazine biosynthesis protein [Bacteroidales bacterium]HNW49291.1 PhzF family phenazine biosynthesis protein [Bacteroidales bacterium]HPS95082.1 PhzF family phenazine biosynthesis protein [Bacteroidales bacterium]